MDKKLVKEKLQVLKKELKILKRHSGLVILERICQFIELINKEEVLNIIFKPYLKCGDFNECINAEELFSNKNYYNYLMKVYNKEFKYTIDAVIVLTINIFNMISKEYDHLNYLLSSDYNYNSKKIIDNIVIPFTERVEYKVDELKQMLNGIKGDNVPRENLVIVNYGNIYIDSNNKYNINIDNSFNEIRHEVESNVIDKEEASKLLKKLDEIKKTYVDEKDVSVKFTGLLLEFIKNIFKIIPTILPTIIEIFERLFK